MVTSRRLPMMEIGGDAATYIEPDNIDQAAAAIAGRICARSQPCDKSLKNAERFLSAVPNTSARICRFTNRY